MTSTTPTTTRLLLKSCVVALALCSAMKSGLAQSVPEAQTAREYEAALAAYENSHWQQAFDALAKLADKGHPEAARMALRMKRFGSALYGREFVATGRQEELWARR